MDNLIPETNARLQNIVDDLRLIKEEYEQKIARNKEAISEELAQANKYKEDFLKAKEKVSKMTSDINGFQEDYQNLVDRFKDDELANILIAANKEIAAKIEERKAMILEDQKAMNELVNRAQVAKKHIVKLNAEKKALENCFQKISDALDFYGTNLCELIAFAEENPDNLASYYKTAEDDATNSSNVTEESEETVIEIDDNQVFADQDLLESKSITPDTIMEDDSPKEMQEESTDEVNEEDETNDNFSDDIRFEEEFQLEDILNIDDSIKDDEE